MSAEVAAVLREARALIEDQRNWIKGEAQRQHCYCAVGALIAIHAPGSALTALHRCTNGLVSTFNDHPDTTHADVLALFDRAIAAEEASHD